MKDLMLFCDVCASVLYSEFNQIRNKEVYINLTNLDSIKHIKECKTQFLDVDDIVKSCFQAYIEHLISKYKYALTPYTRPERSKRKDSDKCNKCFLVRVQKISRISVDDMMNAEPKGIVDLSEMRCSEHCGNTVRTK